MTLPEDFVSKLEFIHPKDIIELLRKKDRPKGGTRWVLKNEIPPVDLYCYLGSRFGQPNGIQNFLRGDHSDNLVHWEWFLRCGESFVTLQGLNFRTEVWIAQMELSDVDREAFIRQLKAEFAKHGQALGVVRKALEHWVEFVNPYRRLRRSVDTLMAELSALGLDASRDSVPDLADQESPGTFEKKWNEYAEKYSRAIGLCFGIRSMLPVMGEAFVNLLLYVLMKPDLRQDDRLRENVVRQPIDIRIKSLSHNCVGFKQAPDYSSEPCKRYHSLVNERNDLLHGNVVVDKLKFNELYFFGRVPVFIEYSSMWERSFGVAHRSAGLEQVSGELAVIDALVEYLLSCVGDKIRDKIRFISERFTLGLNLDDRRLGVLFSERLVDFVPSLEGPEKKGKDVEKKAKTSKKSKKRVRQQIRLERSRPK